MDGYLPDCNLQMAAADGYSDVLVDDAGLLEPLPPLLPEAELTDA